jgi:hypothetical protein
MTAADDRYNPAEKGRARWLRYWTANAERLNDARRSRDRAESMVRNEAAPRRERFQVGLARPTDTGTIHNGRTAS